MRHRGFFVGRFFRDEFDLACRYTANPYSMGVAMKWRVRFMRKAGRRTPWKILINEPGLVGTIRTHSCTYGHQEPYNVAVLNVSDSPIAEGIELLEPQLLMLGDQALILRGYERLQNEEGPFTVLQEWRCEPC